MKNEGEFGYSWQLGVFSTVKEEWQASLVDPAFYTLLAVVSLVSGLLT